MSFACAKHREAPSESDCPARPCATQPTHMFCLSEKAMGLSQNGRAEANLTTCRVKGQGVVVHKRKVTFPTPIRSVTVDDIARNLIEDAEKWTIAGGREDETCSKQTIKEDMTEPIDSSAGKSVNGRTNLLSSSSLLWSSVGDVLHNLQSELGLLIDKQEKEDKKKESHSSLGERNNLESRNDDCASEKIEQVESSVLSTPPSTEQRKTGLNVPGVTCRLSQHDVDTSTVDKVEIYWKQVETEPLHSLRDSETTEMAGGINHNRVEDSQLHDYQLDLSSDGGMNPDREMETELHSFNRRGLYSDHANQRELCFTSRRDLMNVLNDSNLEEEIFLKKYPGTSESEVGHGDDDDGTTSSTRTGTSSSCREISLWSWAESLDLFHIIASMIGNLRLFGQIEWEEEKCFFCRK